MTTERSFSNGKNPGRHRRRRNLFQIPTAVFLTILSLVVLPVSAALAGPGDTGEGGAPIEGEIDDERFEVVNRQSSGEAEATDIRLIAESHGWTIEQAEARQRAAEEVGALAEFAAANYPDQFVGSALAADPEAPPTLYLKGNASQELIDMAGSADVTLRESMPYSFNELEERKIAVHRAAEAMGFDYVATSFGIDDAGTIDLEVAMSTEAGDGGVAPEVQAEAVTAELPAELRDTVNVTMADPALFEDQDAFGGMRIRSGTHVCTSGWTVYRISDGTRGVSTAGHCTGMNEIVHPGHGNHATSFRAEHRGQWGDIEWHTTAQNESARFYSDANNIRNVNAVEARANITLGETVCVYGRNSNSRDCSLDVEKLSHSCTVSGVYNDRLVRMNGHVTTGGDSGGGWSLGNRAYGSTKGNCGGNVWSVADLYDEALGVRVLTK